MGFKGSRALVLRPGGKKEESRRGGGVRRVCLRGEVSGSLEQDPGGPAAGLQLVFPGFRSFGWFLDFFLDFCNFWGTNEVRAAGGQRAQLTSLISDQ